ncbi:MAG: hypothetical protein J1G30_04250 [Spirochaetales bacterium]|nr:hypothetical protein [Spirochaetales bacterium]
MASGIKIIEDGIIELLKDGLRDVIPVKPFSDDIKKNDFLYARNEVLVQYTGTQYNTPANFAQVGCIQKEHKKFDITVINRDLRSSEGAYDILDSIKKILFGAKLKSGENIILIADFFSDYQEEAWIYTLQIEVLTNYIKE